VIQQSSIPQILVLTLLISCGPKQPIDGTTEVEEAEIQPRTTQIIECAPASIEDPAGAEFGQPVDIPTNFAAAEACDESNPCCIDGEVFQRDLLEERIDLNGDGFFDVTSRCIPKMNFEEDEDGESTAIKNLTCRFEAIMLRKEVDLNWDGAPDRIRYYEDGELLRISNDGDFDGFFEWTDYYQGGTLVLTEKDPDRDGKIEIFKNYQLGRLTRIRRDTDGDDLIDLWEYFNEAGEIDKIGLDTDQPRDGMMDVRRE
jgi:hypothetical protein